MNKWWRSSLIGAAAVVLTTISLQASDYWRTGTSPWSTDTGPCPSGMVLLSMAQGSLCVDTFEASPAAECPYVEIANSAETQENLNDFSCVPQTAAAAMPWRYVSLAQAQQLCARVGKRIPTPDEWYSIALTLHDSSDCALQETDVQPTGSSQCVSPSGVADVIGNVWEWVDVEIIDGQYQDRPLPESGFVAQVDSDGVVVETGDMAKTEYGEDYARTNQAGIYGMVRGGFFGSGTDGGLYAQNLAVALDIKTPGIGFRCVASL